jgi:transcriptional regulator with XRE-family HTH domain
MAYRFKKIRKVKKINQQELSLMSNVSYGTIKRFETTGEISLHSLIKLCVALDMQYEITNMFKEMPYKDISEVIKYGK